MKNEVQSCRPVGKSIINLVEYNRELFQLFDTGSYQLFGVIAPIISSLSFQF